MDRDVRYCRDENIFGKPVGVCKEDSKFIFLEKIFFTRKSSYISIGGGIRSLQCANIYIRSNLERGDILQRRYSALLRSEGNHLAALKIC